VNPLPPPPLKNRNPMKIFSLSAQTGPKKFCILIQAKKTKKSPKITNHTNRQNTIIITNSVDKSINLKSEKIRDFFPKYQKVSRHQKNQEKSAKNARKNQAKQIRNITI